MYIFEFMLMFILIIYTEMLMIDWNQFNRLAHHNYNGVGANQRGTWSSSWFHGLFYPEDVEVETGKMATSSDIRGT